MDAKFFRVKEIKVESLLFRRKISFHLIVLRYRCLRILRIHSRRVHTIEWHSTVDNAIISASMDGRIVMWNIESDQIVYVIEGCYAHSFALRFNKSIIFILKILPHSFRYF